MVGWLEHDRTIHGTAKEHGLVLKSRLERSPVGPIRTRRQGRTRRRGVAGRAGGSDWVIVSHRKDFATRKVDVISLTHNAAARDTFFVTFFG